MRGPLPLRSRNSPIRSATSGLVWSGRRSATPRTGRRRWTCCRCARWPRPWPSWPWAHSRQCARQAGGPCRGSRLRRPHNGKAPGADPRRFHDPAGKHHFAHATGTDEVGHSHRGATADEDAVAPLGQLVNGVGFGDTHMGGRGQLQAATDHRALHGGDHRDAAVLQAVEDAVPAWECCITPKGSRF